MISNYDAFGASGRLRQRHDDKNDVHLVRTIFSPPCLENPCHEQHDKAGIERMQNDAGQVMAERIESSNSAVESMKSPGKRVPVTFIRMGKGPPEKINIKEANGLIFNYTVIIVPCHNESIPKSRKIYD
jgi:hypothetical protein